MANERIDPKAFGVVGVLVSSETTVNRLTEETREAVARVFFWFRPAAYAKFIAPYAPLIPVPQGANLIPLFYALGMMNEVRDLLSA